MPGLENRRIIGIDLLKIIMMFFIVVGHLLWHGNVWGGVISGQYSNGYKTLICCIDIVSSCAVNCYAMATGYLMIEKKISWRRLVLLWLQVEVFSAFCLIFIPIFGVDWSLKSLVSSFFPILRNQYWYFTSYFFLYLLIPFLNTMLQNISVKMHRNLCLILLLTHSVLAIVISTDIFPTNRGYSLTWLIILYILGAYFRRYTMHIKKKDLLICIVISILVVYFMELLGSYIFDDFKTSRDYIVGYDKITLVVCSVLIFSLFCQIKTLSVKRHEHSFLEKAIISISGATFGIYLFHNNIWVIGAILSNTYEMVSEFHNEVLQFFVILFIGFTLFLTGYFLDICRAKLTNKVVPLFENKKQYNSTKKDGEPKS